MLTCTRLERISKLLSPLGRGRVRGEIRGEQALTPALSQWEREVLKCALECWAASMRTAGHYLATG